jgi:CRP-like cAMP-binding protein
MGDPMHLHAWAGTVGTGTFVGAGWVSAWLVPSILALLVLLAIWVGVRWSYSEYLIPLRSVPLFKGLSLRQLRAIALRIRRAEFVPLSTITQEGREAEGFYLVERGTAKVMVGGEEKGSLGPGGYFGEIALIDGGPRSATVAAVSQVSLLELPSSAFLRLVDSDPSVALVISTELRRRLRGAGRTIPDDIRPADRAALVQLCRQLREVEEADWGQASAPKRRWWDRGRRRQRWGRPGE